MTAGGEEGSPYAAFSLKDIDYAADLSTVKGKRAVFARNLAAIRVMKRLEVDGRGPDELEARLLKSYSGFGGMPEAFDPRNTAWQDEYRALRHFLTHEEYASARASILDAFYTPHDVTAAIVEGVASLGFASGNILEPSCGSGRFFDAMPEAMRKESHIVGIEMDTLTARIARAAHPDVEIFAQSLQRSRFADGSFDLAIGNVPFGVNSIFGDEKYEGQGLKPHDYFLLKMLDEVRPGGIVAAITATGTMDKGSTAVRDRLAEKGELLAAIRLPGDTFASAGTEAATDLLIFRRKDGRVFEDAAVRERLAPAGWREIQIYPDSAFKERHTINRYFQQNEEDILGTLRERSGKFGPELYVERHPDKELADAIREAFARIPRADYYTPPASPLPPPVQREEEQPHDIGYSIENGALVYTDVMGETREPELTEEEKARVLSAVNLRDAGLRVLDAQAKGVSNEDLRALQKKFRACYDAHLERYGRIQKDRLLLRLFAEDTSYPFLTSLEVYNRRKEFERLSDVFTERTIQGVQIPDHADTAADALVISIQQKGEIDLRYMEQLTGQKEEELIRDLEYTHIYFDEASHKYIEASEFLSGDIYAKIARQGNIIEAAEKEIRDICDRKLSGGAVLLRTLSESAMPELSETPSRLERQLHFIVSHMERSGRLPARLFLESGLGFSFPSRYERGGRLDFSENPFLSTREMLALVIRNVDFEKQPELRPVVAGYFVAAARRVPYPYEGYERMFTENEADTAQKLFGDQRFMLECFKRDPEYWRSAHGIDAGTDDFISKVAAGYAVCVMNQPGMDHSAALVVRSVQNNLAARDGISIHDKLAWLDAVGDFLLSGSKVSEQLEGRRLDDPETVSTLQNVEAPEPLAHHYELLPEEAREEIKAKEQQIARAKKNREALETVKPEHIPVGEIAFSIGSPWLKREYVEDFICEALEIDKTYWNPRTYRDDDTLKVTYVPETSTWRIEPSNSFVREYGARGTKWQTPGMQMFSTTEKGCIELLNDCLNQKKTQVVVDGRRDAELSIAAQAKQDAIEAAFRTWLLKDVKRAQEVEDAYNRQFNNIRLRQYDGANLQFPDMANTITLHPHQKDAIAHHLFGGNTLFAHCVGAGKTYEMIASIMESKRMGLSKKAMMVVPAHLVQQTAEAFRELYPRATRRIYAPTKNEVAGTEGIKRLSAKIATQNLDCVILPYSTFQRLKLSPETEAGYLQQEIDKLDDRYSELVAVTENPKKNFTIKQLQKRISRLKDKLQYIEKVNQKKGIAGAIPFDRLGIDKLVIDEAHYYKNLPIETSHTNVGNIGSSDHSEKCWNLLMKTKYLNEKTGGRGLIFATGTPIANSMSELYTLQRYLTPDVLQNAGISHFDAWCANFGEILSEPELRPEGKGFQTKERLRTFKNTPELSTQFRLFADVRTPEQLPDRHVPEANIKIDEAPASSFQKEKINELFERGESIRKGKPDTVIRKDGVVTDDSMLIITREGRALSLDPRIETPSAADLPDSKVNRCVKNVVREYEASAATSGTQIIFCDTSISTSDAAKKGAFNVYDDLRAKLIAAGVKPEEIAVVQETKKDQLEEKIFAPMREGKIRILLGSTDSLGVGTNVQTKIVAQHDLSVPWRPADLEQRMGRAIRPGNENKSVNIYRYVTQGTFDAYMWQTLEVKQRVIAQMISGNTTARTISDMDEVTLSFADLKAISTDNPLFKDKMELENELARLQIAKAGYETTKQRLKELAEITGPKELRSIDARISGLMHDKMLIDENTEKNELGGEIFRMKIGDTVYQDPLEAARVLHEAAKGGRQSASKIRGEYRGMKLFVRIDDKTKEPFLSLCGTIFHRVAFAQPGKELTTIHALDHVKTSIEKKIVQLKEDRSPIERNMSSAKEKIKEPFDGELRLKEVQKRLMEINAKIETASESEKAVNGYRANEAPEPCSQQVAATSDEAAMTR